MNRRELLTAFLGVTAAGCSRTPPLPPGEIVGASAELGHRLREIPPTPTSWESVPVIIVGGGVAGLSAAWRLLRAGFDRFALVELEPAVGGTSRGSADGVVPHPWGAHYLPAPMADNNTLLTLLNEIGVVEGTDDEGEPVYAEQALCRDPHERLFAYGEWHDGLYLTTGANDDDREQRRRFFDEVDRWVGWRDGQGRKAFTLPTAAGSDDPEVMSLDRMTMAEWLDRRKLSSRRLRWSVDYGCRDDYGTRPEDTSAWAGLFYFASRRRKPGAEPQPQLTWPDGNGRIVRHLAAKAKDRLRLGLAVVDVNPIEKGVEVTAISSSRVVGLRAEQVIFAAPHFLTRFAIRPWREEPPAHVAAFDYGSWMVANLHLSARPREQGTPLAWDNVLYDSPSLGYVVATHQAGRDFGPTIFTYYYPLTMASPSASRRQLLSLGRDEWAELALADLERAHPEIRRLVTRLDVMRWGHAMIRPTPGFVSGPARREAQKPYRNIHFAHSDLSGVALFEEAFDHGVRAAEEVLRRRGDDTRPAS